MKISGLLFERINEEFEIFTNGLKERDLEGLTNDRKAALIGAYEERILNDSLKTLHDRYPDFFKAHSKNQKVISKEMEESFRYFFAYLNCVDNIYEKIRIHLKENKVASNYAFVIPHYGLLVRLSDQIGAMLLNGYPDGALRIWRSFYEYGIITLLFIKEIENHLLQQKFISHFHRTKRRKSESYQKHHEELKFPSLDENHFTALNKRITEINTQYGKDFLDDEYGWCKGIINTTKRVTLRDIEEYVDFKHLRPFYIWASGYTHPGFASMLDFFQEDKQMVILNEINRQTLRKQSFIDPMQLTLSLFDQVNVEFLKIFSADSEYDINIQMLREIFDALITSFGKIS